MLKVIEVECIEALENSLEKYTRENFPQEWGNIQYHLALAYYRTSSEKDCLSFLENSLEIFTYAQNPEKWTLIQISRLCILYDSSKNSNDVENLLVFFDTFLSFSNVSSKLSLLCSIFVGNLLLILNKNSHARTKLNSITLPKSNPFWKVGLNFVKVVWREEIFFSTWEC